MGSIPITRSTLRVYRARSMLPSPGSSPAATGSIKMARLDFSLNRLYLHSDAPAPPLRVGVMIDGTSVNRFARQILVDILASNFASISCVIENRGDADAPPRPRASLVRRVADTFLDGEKRRRLFYRAYMRWIDARYRLTPDPVEMVDCSDLVPDVPRVAVTPMRTRFVDRFPDASVAAILAQNLDVILRFGFRIIRGDVLRSAHHGVWSFHHDDSSCYRGGPSQLWELIEGNPVSGAVLQRLEDALDAGAVLAKVNLSSASVPSVSANRFNVYWSTQHLVIQKLHELHRYGAEHLRSRTVEPGEYTGRKKIYRTPDNLEIGRWLVPRIVKKGLRTLLKRRLVRHWRIGLRKSGEPLHRTAQPDLRTFAWMQSPRGRFWADPFLLEHEGSTWLFFEDYGYREKRATIACGRLEDDGRMVDVRTALDRPYHLSYPHVFNHDGAVWMVPESYEAGAVELYRAERFPDRWVLERPLLELSAMDATPFQHDGRWWMFVSPATLRDHLPLTLLFTAPQLAGPWALHPASPICSHVRWSRSAGQVFRDGGQLVRPSQDCSADYGYSVCFNRITRLNEREYAEAPGRTILPDSLPGLGGFHTYNRVGDWEVVDGKFPLRERRIL
jgi:hypothetical protein